MADNPFMKTDTVKYYPEIHVILENGTVFSTIGPNKKLDLNFGNSQYVENFRDDKLKINDDRKVKLTLSDFKNKRNIMVLLTVRVVDSKNANANPAAFKQAWYRLQNEDTNQTLDYSYIDKVKKEAGMEDPDEEQPEDDEGEEGEEKVKSETIFLAGRLYREDTEIKKKPNPEGEQQPEGEASKEEEAKYKTRWIYERWNKVINSAQFENIPQTLADLLKNCRSEIRSNKNRVKEAREAVIRAAEEKKAALAAAAQKKAKAAKKGGKKDDAPPEEEEKKREIKPT